MPFDIYFAGGLAKECVHYIAEHGGNRLCSQLLERKPIRNWIDLNPTGKLFIDSGAYSAYTKQRELDVEEYIQYINSIDEHVTIFAQVDKIPGQHGKPKTREEVLEAPELSWNNYLDMRPKVKSVDKLLPIFHRREDFKWLRQMLETTFDGKHIPYIGIAATTDSSVTEKREWFEQVFSIIESSSNPNVKTHAFGMTSLQLLELYPFTSADSTSALMTAAMGGIMTDFGVLSVSSVRSNEMTHYTALNNSERTALIKYITDAGFDIQRLAERYQDRMIWNAYYIMKWAENYQFKGTKKYRRRLF